MGQEMIQAYTWKEASEEKVDYKVQVEILGATKWTQNKVKKMFNDWVQFIEGHSHRENKIIIGYKRPFENEKEWKKWVKEFPHSVYQIKKNGTAKLLKKGK
tara:strand:+ start:977 stop:1279 length:303 start_codon:yes stop_codon:yes gene_type:complete